MYFGSLNPELDCCPRGVLPQGAWEAQIVERERGVKLEEEKDELLGGAGIRREEEVLGLRGDI